MDTCPNCGEPVDVIYRPTNRFFERMGLSDGIHCDSCGARLSYSSGHDSLTTIAGLPYVLMLAWNVFVAQYGERRYGLEKIDIEWLVVSLLVFGVAIVLQWKNRRLVVNGERLDKAG